MTVPLRFVTEPLRFLYSSFTVSLRFVTPYYAFVTAPRLREKKKQAHKQSKSHKQSKNEVEAGGEGSDVTSPRLQEMEIAGGGCDRDRLGRRPLLNIQQREGVCKRVLAGRFLCFLP